jgi:uncharacterized Zn finger protein
MIFDARCPHCSAAHVVPLQAVETDVRCPKCGRQHPVHPKAQSATEAPVAELVQVQRDQVAAIRRVEIALVWLRLAVGMAVAAILLFGVGVTVRR